MGGSEERLNDPALRARMKADILVLDFAKLHDNSDYDHHDAEADGVEYVVINDTVAVDRGELLPVCVGKVLKSTDGCVSG